MAELVYAAAALATAEPPTGASRRVMLVEVRILLPACYRNRDVSKNLADVSHTLRCSYWRRIASAGRAQGGRNLWGIAPVVSAVRVSNEGFPDTSRDEVSGYNG